METAKSKRRAWAFGCGALLLLVAIPSGLLMAGITGRAQQEDSDLAAAKKEGAIITAKDLQERYGAHGQPNAGPMLIEYGKYYEATPVAEKDRFRKLFSDWRVHGGEPPDELVAASKKAVDQFGSLDQFLRFEHCEMVPDWSRLSAFPYRAWDGARRLEQALVIVAIHQSAVDDLAGLERSILCLYRLAQDVAETPMSVCLLLQLRSLRYVDQLMVDCARKDPDNVQMQALFRRMLAQKPDVSVKRALEGEMYASWQVVDNLDHVLDTDTSIPEKFKREIRLAALIPGMREAWRASDLDWLRTVRFGINEHPYDWKAFESRLKALVPSTLAGIVQPEQLIESLLHPSSIGRMILTAEMHAEAIRRAAITALSQIYGTHEVEIDPFSQKPMVLGGWTVRSVGPDGAAQPEGNAGDDIIIRFAQRPKG